MDVEVAVLLAPFGAFTAPPAVVERSGWEIAWPDRARAVVQTSDDSTIGQILDAAADELGVRARSFESGDPIPASREVAGVSFFIDDENEGRNKGRRSYPTLDSQGGVRWDEEIVDVTIIRAIDAATARVLKGDPRRIYLVPQSSAGGFGIDDWDQVLKVLQIADQALEHLGAVAAGLGVVFVATKKLWTSGQAVVARLGSRWSDRGGSISDVGSVVSLEDRRAPELARLLGCSTDEADSLIAVFGRSQTPDREASPESEELVVANRLIRATTVITEAGLLYRPNGEEEARQVLEQIALEVARGAQLDDEKVRAMVYRIVNPNYGNWAG